MSKTRSLLWGFRRYLRYATAATLLAGFKIGLQTLGYKRLSALLVRYSRAPNPAAVDPEQALYEAYLVSRYVLRASKFILPASTCLERSLLIWWLLRQRNIVADVRIGVRKDNGAISAHAWVEYNGVVVNDREDVNSLYAVHPDAVSPLKIAKLV